MCDRGRRRQSKLGGLMQTACKGGRRWRWLAVIMVSVFIYYWLAPTTNGKQIEIKPMENEANLPDGMEMAPLGSKPKEMEIKHGEIESEERFFAHPKSDEEIDENESLEMGVEGQILKKPDTVNMVNDDNEKSARGEGNQIDNSPASVKYTADWESLDSRPIPEWYDQSKIGIFIHWGVYSVPSFVDVGTHGLAEWFWYYWKTPIGEIPERHMAAAKSARNYMDKTYPSHFQYTDFARDFTGEFFEPKKWAEIFKASGAGYVVLTSKHHDGFTLWPSKHSWNWNSVDNGPHRDIVKDLGDAVRKTGLKYGLYHSLHEWFNPMYLADRKNNYKTQDFVTHKVGPELHDLVETYKPDILWSDGGWEDPDTYWNSTQFLAWLYNQSPVKDTVMTNDRWGEDIMCHHGGVLTCSDRFIPKEQSNRKWENCMTLDRESWGFRRNARLENYFCMFSLTKLLARTISKGGNLLMNVGPTADGRILPVFEERLTQLGDWLKVNGEAVYNTTTWTYSKEDDENVFYTRKSSVVYAIVTKWPEDDSLVLKHPIPGEELKVTWLGYGSVQWTKGDTSLTLNLPKVSMAHIPCQYAWSFKLEGLTNAL